MACSRVKFTFYSVFSPQQFYDELRALSLRLQGFKVFHVFWTTPRCYTLSGCSDEGIKPRCSVWMEIGRMSFNDGEISCCKRSNFKGRVKMKRSQGLCRETERCVSVTDIAWREPDELETNSNTESHSQNLKQKQERRYSLWGKYKYSHLCASTYG
jgi:hypothetical protein